MEKWLTPFFLCVVSQMDRVEPRICELLYPVLSTDSVILLRSSPARLTGQHWSTGKLFTVRKGSCLEIIDNKQGYSRYLLWKVTFYAIQRGQHARVLLKWLMGY